MAKETNIFLMENMTVHGLCIAITNRDITFEKLLADLVEVQEAVIHEPDEILLSSSAINSLDYVYATYPKELCSMFCQLLSNAAFKLKKDGNLLAHPGSIQESNS